MQRPSKLKPNQTAGEKMILEAQVPKAMAAFQSNLRSPLKYKAMGARAKPTPWITRPLFPRRQAKPVAITPSSESPTHKGSSTVSTAGILPMCHAAPGQAMGESTRLPLTTLIEVKQAWIINGGWPRPRSLQTRAQRLMTPVD
jgi:hypothetical protein